MCSDKFKKQGIGGEKYYRMLQRFPYFITNSYFSQLIQRADPIEKKTIAKRSEFALIRADKIVMLSFMTFGTDLVMMFDKKGMLKRLVMLPFRL